MHAVHRAQSACETCWPRQMRMDTSIKYCTALAIRTVDRSSEGLSAVDMLDVLPDGTQMLTL